jgi:putative metalloprotease
VLTASPLRACRLALACAALVCCAALAGCDETDVSLATNAAVDAVRAATLSDEAVRDIAVRAARESDARHTKAAPDSAYAQRLRRLVGQNFREGGRDFNVGVYVSPEVNAFAMADGTIRIYSGLMDLLDDGELQFVIGHEAGHVTKEHLRKKIQFAYAASAVRKGIASQSGAAGDVAGSVIGGLAESLLTAQFSQLEEKDADDAGLAYLKGKSLDPASAVSALKKIAGLGKGHSFLSSHPDPDLRAERIQAQIDGRALPMEETRRGIMERLSASLAAAREFVLGQLRFWLP